MQGLALARAYFDAYGAPMIERQFAAYKSSMAVGLVGEGSECFGYDDAFSQDHDFGPGFCIWLPQTVYAEIGAELKKCADVIAETDCKMLSIRQKIEEKHPTQEEYRDVNE